MKYLIFLCVVISGCSVFRKSVNTVLKEASKSSITTTDSAGRTSLDSTAIRIISGWKTITLDSNYDMITEEIVKEVIDSNNIRRETTRIIKERGQKRIEQSSQMSKYDSARHKTEHIGVVRQIQQQDSTGLSVTKKKDVARSSFLPWWIWLIVAAVASLIWWKRNPIIELFI